MEDLITTNLPFIILTHHENLSHEIEFMHYNHGENICRFFDI